MKNYNFYDLLMKINKILALSYYYLNIQSSNDSPYLKALKFFLTIHFWNIYYSSLNDLQNTNNKFWGFPYEIDEFRKLRIPKSAFFSSS